MSIADHLTHGFAAVTSGIRAFAWEAVVTVFAPIDGALNWPGQCALSSYSCTLFTGPRIVAFLEMVVFIWFAMRTIWAFQIRDAFTEAGMENGWTTVADRFFTAFFWLMLYVLLPLVLLL